ncbi:unnamed protein product [Chrysodeixis includens]|uniref:Uncharacterized protein n=1 Tax=Chrysodeixis includens TaxID=689277 RepID=A0A9N8KSH6_CHRIL|nr:unnamed protein product [Chrysodeixis includens]
MCGGGTRGARRQVRAQLTPAPAHMAERASRVPRATSLLTNFILLASFDPSFIYLPLTAEQLLSLIAALHSTYSSRRVGLLNSVVEESRRAGRGAPSTRMRRALLPRRSDDPSLSVDIESSREHTVPSCTVRQLSRVVM